MATAILGRMGKRTIYVREDDAEIWERAEAYAKARRLPMSALVMTALEAYLDAQAGERESGDMATD